MLITRVLRRCLPLHHKILSQQLKLSACRCMCSTGALTLKNEEGALALKKKGEETFRNLQAKIMMTGPITVAEYMETVLVNPESGYYMDRDVFGQEGDFTTSPEISQMFGEMLGVWIYDQWKWMGKQSPLNIVELGPGRGTLADDILRTLKKLHWDVWNKDIMFTLVDVSHELRKIQMKKLCGSSEMQHYINLNSKYNIALSWYDNLKDVPTDFCCFIAHEFLDVLPVHKFQRTENGWREVLIDIDLSTVKPSLRFVLAKGPTPATLFIPEDETRDHIEISPKSRVWVEEITTRIVEHGGCALFVDYGHDGTKTDTFRGFKKHALHDPLLEPGTADLTCDVDFSFLKRALKDKDVLVYGPITQETFLKNMGIDIRLKVLLDSNPPEKAEGLKSGYDMIVNPANMGERFKFFGVYPKVMENIFRKYRLPSGFKTFH